MEREFTSDELESYERFLKWQNENAPRVAKMKEPITIKQFFILIETFGKHNVAEVLEAMHNKADLHKKYISAYLTARNWCKRQTKTETDSNDLSPVAKKIKDAEKR